MKSAEDRVPGERRFKVRAEYSNSGMRVEHAHVVAETRERAAMKAIFERHLPIEFLRSSDGRWEPIFWRPDFYEDARWPWVVSERQTSDGATEICLGWGDSDSGGTLLLFVRPSDEAG
jgi:hypothetical protein